MLGSYHFDSLSHSERHPRGENQRSVASCEDRMNAKTRQRLEMGARALRFSRRHPHDSPAYAAAIVRLETRLEQARGEVRKPARARIAEAKAGFGSARPQRNQGGAKHLTGTVQLERVADEVALIVAVLDRLNHVRFAQDSELLGDWKRASNVGASPVDDLPPAA